MMHHLAMLVRQTINPVPHASFSISSHQCAWPYARYSEANKPDADAKLCGVRQPPLPYLTASQSSVLPWTGTGPIYPHNLAHPLFKWTCTPNEARDTVRLDMYE